MCCTQVNPSVTEHLRNFNKQHLILAKFYANNGPSIGNQNAKFLFSLLKQTITAAVFVTSPQNTSFSGFCVWRHPQRPETKRFWGDFI